MSSTSRRVQKRPARRLKANVTKHQSRAPRSFKVRACHAEEFGVLGWNVDLRLGAVQTEFANCQVGETVFVAAAAVCGCVSVQDYQI